MVFCIQFLSFPIGTSTSIDTFQTAHSNFDTIPTNVATLNANPNLRAFTLSELKAATKDFDASRKIGEGGFAIVYRGTVKSLKHPFNGFDVAVKRGKRGQQGYKPWVTEINVLGEINHPNLVKLTGYCNEDLGNESQLLLVYEYMPKGSLDVLLASNEPPSWAMRLKIAKDAATGLVYLHEGMSKEIIFRDFKPSNILLDNYMNAKLSDFGFARDGPQDGKTHVSSMVVGTKGYAAPEYVQTGRLTSKIDVWSYGIFLKELITGRRPLGNRTSDNNPQIVKWVCCYGGGGKSKLVVDPRLKGKYCERSTEKVEVIVNKCLVKDAKLRPTMSEVLEMVNEAIALENPHLSNGG